MTKPAKRADCAQLLAYSPDLASFIPLRCGKWDCSICAEINAVYWSVYAAHGIAQLMSDGVMLSVWTLTLTNKIRSSKRAFEVLPKIWDAFRKNFPSEYRYIAFVEHHTKRTKIPHLHLITDISWDFPTLKQYAIASGFGWKCYLQTVYSPGAGWYISKYVAKHEAVKKGMPKNFRRVRQSRKWPKMPDESESVYSYLIKRPSETLTAFLDRIARNVAKSEDELLTELAHAIGNFPSHLVS
jgi:hypothetical protein